jgi:hypothetical protein
VGGNVGRIRRWRERDREIMCKEGEEDMLYILGRYEGKGFNKDNTRYIEVHMCGTWKIRIYEYIEM